MTSSGYKLLQSSCTFKFVTMRIKYGSVLFTGILMAFTGGKLRTITWLVGLVTEMLAVRTYRLDLD